LERASLKAAVPSTTVKMLMEYISIAEIYAIERGGLESHYPLVIF
jgi:hypothetical protein